jgi:hypothetical protein
LVVVRKLDIYLWVMLSSLVALGVVIIVMPGDGVARRVTISGALAAASAVATFFVIRAFRASRRQPALRLTWVLFSLGALGWFAGAAYTFYNVALRGEAMPYPSFADLSWGVGAAFVIAALAVKVARRPPRVSGQAVAGALATAGLAMLLAVHFVIIPALHNPGLTPGDRAAEVFLATVNFALGALALVVIALYGGRGMGRPWAQLALGLIFYAAGNAIHWHLTEAGLYGPAGNVVTALFWTAAYLMVGLGAYYRRLVLRGEITFPPAEAEEEVRGG